MSFPRTVNVWLVIGVALAFMVHVHVVSRPASMGNQALASISAADAEHNSVSAKYSPSPDLQAAKAAIAEKRYRTAQLHAIRILGHHPDHCGALSLLLQAADSELDELVEAGEFLLGGQRLEEAEQCFLAFREEVLLTGTTPGTIGEVQEAERSLQALDRRPRGKVSAAARKNLNEAKQYADKAYSYVWYSNRDEVRKGLKRLR